MSFARSIEAEWLDALSPDDPRAMRSRRDLRRVNGIMQQVGIMARLLEAHHSGARPRRLVELGGGDGTFMLRVAQRLGWPDVELMLVDQQDIVAEHTCECFATLGWRLRIRQANVFDFLGQESEISDVVTANLFLHHFGDAELVRLLAGAAGLAPLFVACEPRRSAPALLGARMLFAIGCNDVSRHDAVASVRAGFAGSELSGLWPTAGNWRFHERPAWPFTHAFVASMT